MNPQQVLDFIQTRGGTTSLRELRHFPVQIIERLKNNQIINVERIGSEYQVCLNLTKITPAKIEPLAITEINKYKKQRQIIKKEPIKPKVPKPRYTKVTVDKRKNREAPIKTAIFEVVKHFDVPMNAEDVQIYFPNISIRAIQHHLRLLEDNGNLFSTNRKCTYWADSSKAHLLEGFADIQIGRKQNRDAVKHILQSATKALSVTNIVEQLPLESKVSSVTVRDILGFFQRTNLVLSSRPSGAKATYYALISNEQAIHHLKQLEADSWDKQIIKLLTERDHYQGELSLIFGGGRCANNSLIKILRQMESEGIIESSRISVNSRLYYSLTKE